MKVALERVIGTYTQGIDGPLMFFLGGIHGNEPAGVYALERVFNTLNKVRPSFKGKFMGVRGNLNGLAVHKRFVHRDLNRLWSAEEITRISGAENPSLLNIEERELLELLPIMRAEFNGSKERQILIDLHTTSAPGGLFSIVTNNSYNRELASALHSPVIFKLTDQLTSTTNILIDRMGWNGIAFEAGQHDDPVSIDNHEAAIWLLLEKAGCIDPDEIPDFEQFHYRLITASRFLPHYVEVVHRHEITDEDEFRMHPGFTNFHQVYKGEPIARDRNGEVICPMTGLMLMPLYQKQGEEGYFIIRRIEEPPA